MITKHVKFYCDDDDDDDDDDDSCREWIIGNNTTTVHQLQYQQIIKHAEKTNEETKKMDYLTGLFYGNFILVPI